MSQLIGLILAFFSSEENETHRLHRNHYGQVHQVRSPIWTGNRPHRVVRDNGQQRVQQVQGQVDLLKYFQIGLLLILGTLILIEVWKERKRARSLRSKKRTKCFHFCIRCFRRRSRRHSVCSNEEEGSKCDAANILNEVKKSEKENEIEEMNNDEIECVVKPTIEESETMIISETPESSYQDTVGPQREEHKDSMSNDWDEVLHKENFSDDQRGTDMEYNDDVTPQIDDTVKEVIHQEDDIIPDCRKYETKPTQEIDEIKGSENSELDPKTEHVSHETAGTIGDGEQVDHTVAEETIGKNEPCVDLFGDERDSLEIGDIEQENECNDVTTLIVDTVKEVIHQEDDIAPDCSKDETKPTEENNEIEGSYSSVLDLNIEHVVIETAGIIGDDEQVDHTVAEEMEEESEPCVELFGDERGSLEIGDIEQENENDDVTEGIDHQNENDVVTKENKLQLNEKPTVVGFDSEKGPKELKNAVKEVGELNEEPREKKPVEVNVSSQKPFGNSERPVEQSEADRVSGTTANVAACSSAPSSFKLLVHQKIAQKQDSIGFERRGCTSSRCARKEMEETSVTEVPHEERGFRPEQKTRSGWNHKNNYPHQNGNESTRDRAQKKGYVGVKHSGYAAPYNGRNEMKEMALYDVPREERGWKPKRGTRGGQNHKNNHFQQYGSESRREYHAQKQDDFGFEYREYGGTYNGRYEMEEMSVYDVPREERGYKPKRGTRGGQNHKNNHFQQDGSESRREYHAQKQDDFGFEYREYGGTYNGRYEMEEMSVYDVPREERGWKPKRGTRGGQNHKNNHFQQDGSESRREYHAQKQDDLGIEYREYGGTYNGRHEMEEMSVYDVPREERGWKPKRGTRGGRNHKNNHFQQYGSESRRGRRY